MIEHLDGLGESAALIGAVNTAVRRDGAWIGENTDGQGFLAALRTVVDPAGKSLVILGAGGAARAIAVEAALAGAAKITVVNRGRERGEELAALLSTLGAAAPSGVALTAAFVPWSGDLAVPDGHRHPRQRHLDRPLPRRRRPRAARRRHAASGGWSSPT